MHLKRLVFLIAVLFISACTKEYLPDTYTEVPAGSAVTFEYLPSYPEYDAMFYSIQETRFENQNNASSAIHTGKARARFQDEDGKLVSAGTVKVQDVPLLLTSNQYVYNPDNLNPEGINYVNSGAHRWTVSGSSQFPEVNFLCTRSLPEISPLLSTSEVIDRSQSFGVNTREGVQNADSLRYTIFSPGGYYYVTRPANSPLQVFTPDKLSVLTPGKGILRLTAFNVTPIEIHGKKLVYINLSITEKEVQIK
jgi:hypothetical protein